MQITPEMVRKLLTGWERLSPKMKREVASALRELPPLTLWVLIFRVPELRRLYRLTVGREPEFKIPEVEDAIEKAMRAITLTRAVEIDLGEIGIEDLPAMFPEKTYAIRVVLTRDERRAIGDIVREALREWLEDVVVKKHGESVESVVRQIKDELYDRALELMEGEVRTRVIERIGGYENIRRELRILLDNLRGVGITDPAELRDHISAVLDMVGECKTATEFRRRVTEYVRRIVRPPAAMPLWPPPGRPVVTHLTPEMYEWYAKRIEERLEELGEIQERVYRPDMSQEEIEEVYFREFPDTIRIPPPPPDAPPRKVINYLAQKLNILRHFKAVIESVQGKTVPPWVDEKIRELEERIEKLRKRMEKE